MFKTSIKLLSAILAFLVLTSCVGTQRDQQSTSISDNNSTPVSTAASSNSSVSVNAPATSTKAANTTVSPAVTSTATASPTATPAATVSAATSSTIVSKTPAAAIKPASTPTPVITVAALPIAATTSVVTKKPALNTYPLRVSSNKRYLVDGNGDPFFISADTGWMLFSNITLSDAEYYLEYRRNQNVNSILCYAAPFFIDAPNKQGDLAFLNNKLATPNEKYFDHVDRVINLAAVKGIQVILCPVEMCNYAPYYTIDNARVLGRYMGKRYKDFDNILWFTGGDIKPTKEQVEITNSLAAGIRDYDKRHLISFHPGGGMSSSDYFNDQSWLDYNMVQVHSPDSPMAYQLPLADYGKTPVRPTILIETCYEDMIKGNPPVSNTPYQIRRSIAWGLLSGGFGISYGNQILYKFIADAQYDWKTTLDHPAFQQTANMANCIKERAWQKLIPDQKHTLLTSGYAIGGSLGYAAAALADDGSFAVIYLPTSREITIDMSQFNGRKQVKWFDPTNNTYTTEGSFLNNGSRCFSAKRKNSAGEYDWFLIIE